MVRRRALARAVPLCVALVCGTACFSLADLTSFPCANDGTCPDGYVCAGAKECIVCGGVGRACCANDRCSGTATCKQSVCICAPKCSPGCGGASDGCGGTCPSTCSSDQVCSSDACVSCGASGQPCCGAASCQNGLGCNDALCAPCGSVGQGCCAGASCNEGLLCAAGACELCPATASVSVDGSGTYVQGCAELLKASLGAAPSMTCVLVGQGVPQQAFLVLPSMQTQDTIVPFAQCCPDRKNPTTLTFACECGTAPSYLLSSASELMSGQYDKTKIVSYATLDSCQ